MIGRRLFVHAVFLTWRQSSSRGSACRYRPLSCWCSCCYCGVGWLCSAASCRPRKPRSWSSQRSRPATSWRRFAGAWTGWPRIHREAPVEQSGLFSRPHRPATEDPHGHVQSGIGNSAEILRYLWGRYAVDDPLLPHSSSPAWSASNTSPAWTATASACRSGFTITS